MTDERYKTLLDLFDGDAAVIDELLGSLARAARGTDKAHLLDTRARFRAKAVQPATFDSFMAGVSRWMEVHDVRNY